MEMLLFSERRAERRAVLVECQAVRERGFVLLGDRAIDLSIQGMLVPSKVEVDLGEEVLVSLCIPGTEHWVDVSATVARVVRDRRWGDRGRAIGLRFSPIEGEDGLLLRWALRRFPPTLSTRAARVDYAATAQLIALD